MVTVLGKVVDDIFFFILFYVFKDNFIEVWFTQEHSLILYIYMVNLSKYL